MIDNKVLEDITNNFKNNLFSDMKILSGLVDSNELWIVLQEFYNKLYK